MIKYIKLTLANCLNMKTSQAKEIIENCNKDMCILGNKETLNIKQYREEGISFEHFSDIILQDMLSTSRNKYPIENIKLFQKFIEENWKSKEQDIFDYRKQIPSYLLNTDYHIANENIKIYKKFIEEKNKNGIIKKQGFDYIVSLKVISKENNINFKIGTIDRNKKIILEKIIDNKYGICFAKVKKEGSKTFLYIGYSLKEENLIIDINRELNVFFTDDGTLELEVYDIITKKNELIDYGYIDFEELLNFRRKIYNLKKRYTLPEKLALINKKANNFVNTYIHNLSKNIIETAISNNCGIIKFPLKNNITKKGILLLNDEEFKDFMDKIEYKATEKGIKLIIK